MTAKDLYEFIKATLSLVGLEEMDMDELEVGISEGWLVFSHCGVETRVEL